MKTTTEPAKSQARVQSLGTTQLMDIAVVEENFNLSRVKARGMLRNLRVPLLDIADKTYFNCTQLDRVLFYLTMPRKGDLVGEYSVPGTPRLNQGREKARNVKRTVTDEDIEAMDDPVVYAKWLTSGPMIHLPKTQLRTLLDTAWKARLAEQKQSARHPGKESPAESPEQESEPEPETERVADGA